MSIYYIHFKTKNAEWSRWKSYLDNEQSAYITSFPETISEEVIDIQPNKFTDVVVNSDTELFGMMIASKKKSKGYEVKT